MDRLFDAAACVAQGNFVKNDTASTAQSQKDGQQGWSSWVSRQITAAYDEHATIIESLREELNTAKTREKALISEFTDRFRKMQESVPETVETYSKQRLEPSYAGDNICYDDENDDEDDDEEMPMDERAEASRIGNVVPNPGRLSQRRKTDRLKEQTYLEMEKMRKENEAKVRSIENALKDKVDEIDRLKKESRGQCIGQGGEGSGSNDNIPQINNQHVRRHRSRSRSPGGPPRSPTSSPRPSRNSSNEKNSMFHSSLTTSLKMQMSTQPRTWDTSVTPINRIRNGCGTPIKNRPSSGIACSAGNVIDNINRVRVTNNNPISTVNPPRSPRPCGGDTIQGNYERSINPFSNTDINWGLEASQMVVDSSAIGNEICPVTPQLPVSSAMVPMNAPNKLQHQPERQQNESQTIQKLLTAIDTLILMQKPADGPSIRLTEEERKFVERIKHIIHSSQKKQKNTITNLKKGLEGTTKELKMETAQTVKLNEELKDNEEYINELEKQLGSANDSLRNTTDLEDMLRMLGGDNKTETELERQSLKQQLLEAEQARDALLQQKDALDKNDSDKSVRAFERVLADVTNEKNEEVGELMRQIDKLKDENGRLNKHLNDSTNSAIRKNSPDNKIDSQELLELWEQRKKTTSLEEEVRKVSQDLEEALAQKKEAILSLQQSKEKMKDIEEEFNIFNNKENGGDVSNENISKLEKLVLDLENQMDDKNKYCKNLLSKVDSQQEIISNLKNENNTMKLNLSECTKRSESFENKVRELTNQTEDFKEQATTVGEALKTARQGHIREEKLEDELCELRSLLDKTIKGKAQLRSEVYAKSEAINTLKKQHARDLKALEADTSRLVQEKAWLEQRSNAVNRTADKDEISMLQETMRNAAQRNQVIRKNLREQLVLHEKLRLVSNWSSNEILDQISSSMSSSLSILESSASPVSVASGNFDFNSGIRLCNTEPAHGEEFSRIQILEDNLKSLRRENEKIREDTSERDQELVLLNTEMQRMKEDHLIKVDLLTKKEDELRVLQENLNENSICYISGDESDSDSENSVTNALSIHAPIVTRKNSYDKEMCANLINAKEEAEERAKKNGESLDNAKAIIASLEQSNKTITEGLRSRLHDSNTALVSILEQSQKHERESAVLRVEIKKLKLEKENDTVISSCDGNNDNRKSNIVHDTFPLQIPSKNETIG